VTTGSARHSFNIRLKTFKGETLRFLVELAPGACVRRQAPVFKFAQEAENRGCGWGPGG